MTGEHALIVPPEGLLELVHSYTRIQEEETLRLRSAGLLVTLTAEEGRAVWLHSEVGQLNPRAHRAWVHLTGTHIQFTGSVMFLDVDETRLGEIVADLSLPDAPR